MKKVILILILFPFLTATQCEDELSCSPSVVEKTKSNLITIENLQESYNVGDIIWLNSTLERNQTFDNPITTIDLFNYPLDLTYYVQFNKSSVYNPSINLCLDENTTEVTNGSINYCNQIIYEKEGDFLKSRVGIKLLETGNYNLSIYNIATYRDTGLNCEDTGINIITTFSNNNLQNINFSVN